MIEKPRQCRWCDSVMDANNSPVTVTISDGKAKGFDQDRLQFPACTKCRDKAEDVILKSLAHMNADKVARVFHIPLMSDNEQFHAVLKEKLDDLMKRITSKVKV